MARPQWVGLQTRRGIVIATRGLGLDLLSADTRGLEAAMDGGSPSYTRALRIMTGEGSTLDLQFYCTLIRTAPDGFREICEVGPYRITNQYQTDAAGLVTFSRQWLGPDRGSVELALSTARPASP